MFDESISPSEFPATVTFVHIKHTMPPPQVVFQSLRVDKRVMTEVARQTWKAKASFSMIEKRIYLVENSTATWTDILELRIWSRGTGSL